MALLLTTAMTVSLMAGCGGKAEKDGSAENSAAASVSAASESTAVKEEAPKPVTIKVSNWPKPDNEANIKVYEGYVAEMKSKYPYITIEGDEWGYDVNSFLPKAASGQLPTIYDTFFTEADKIINSGYCADITQGMTKYGYDKAINPEMLKLVTKESKLYGIPKDGYVLGLMYNVNLFKTAGLVDEKGIPKYPKTWDELAETAKILKDKTGKAGFFFPTKNNQGGWMFMNIAWSYGAEFEKQVDGKWKAMFNSPEAVAALQYVKDLKWKHNVLTDNVLVEVGDMLNLFGTEQVGMAIAADSWPSLIVQQIKCDRNMFALSKLPSGPKGDAAVLGGGLYMMSPDATPEQMDACFKWLEVTGVSPKITPEALKGKEELAKTQNELGLIVGPYGVRVWVNPERIEAENQILKKYTNVNMELFSDYMENGSKGMKPEEPMNAQELYKTLDSVIQAVLTDKNADPQKLLDDAAAGFQKDYLDKIK